MPTAYKFAWTDALEATGLRDAMAPDVKIEAGISTAFGRTPQGVVADEDVVWTS